MDNQDRIDAYLRKELSETERKMFEDELESNSSLAEDFALTKNLVKALESRQQKIRKMERWQQQLDVEERAASTARTLIRRMVIISGIAACVLLGFFSQNSQTGHQLPVFESSGLTYRGQFSDIENIDCLLNEGKYKQALEEIDLQEKEYADIIAHLVSTEQLKEEQIYEKELTEEVLYVLTWRKINVLLVLGKKNEALQILHYYRFTNGLYQKDANRLWARFHSPSL